MADLLAAHLGAERFSWGQKSLTAEGQNRALYLMALNLETAVDRLQTSEKPHGY